jgi:hypothetical protein
MKDGQEKVPGDVDETLDYQEPILVRLGERDKVQLGMCGVGVTGTIPCGPGSAATDCSGGAAVSPF